MGKRPSDGCIGAPSVGENVAIALACLMLGSGLTVIGRRRYGARHR